jgi:hypothetical protein
MAKKIVTLTIDFDNRVELLVPLIQDDNGKIFGLRSTMMFDEMELNDKISIRIYVVKAAGFALKSITPFENINPIGVA